MCRAKEYSEQLQNIFQSIKKDIEQTRIKEGDMDRKQQDILHCIEFGTFNACEGYKICDMLKKIRTERREIKNEINALNILYDGFIKQIYKAFLLKSEQIVNTDKTSKVCTYTPKILNTINVKELCK